MRTRRSRLIALATTIAALGALAATAAAQTPSLDVLRAEAEIYLVTDDLPDLDRLIDSSLLDAHEALSETLEVPQLAELERWRAYRLDREQHRQQLDDYLGGECAEFVATYKIAASGPERRILAESYAAVDHQTAGLIATARDDILTADREINRLQLAIHLGSLDQPAPPPGWHRARPASSGDAAGAKPTISIDQARFVYEAAIEALGSQE